MLSKHLGKLFSRSSALPCRQEGLPGEWQAPPYQQSVSQLAPLQGKVARSAG